MSDSAEAAAASWKLTLPCTRAEAESLAEDLPALALLDQPPTLMTSEPDPAEPDRWRLDAYFEEEPSDALLSSIVALVPSAAGSPARAEPVAEQDWVTLSQAGLEPIRAGRFHVRTPAHPPLAGAIDFVIDAGRAFGTGHHETTAGCLAMLDALRTRGARFADVADVGTGTGLLAFAALALWPAARAVASDIDPVAIEVAAENAAANAVSLGRGRGQVELVVAAGLDHRRLAARPPYDLIVANILAGPLIELAPALSAALAPGGSLLLAGLLDVQADAVAAAYRARRLRLAERTTGEWPVLRLVKRALSSPLRRPRPAGG